MKVDDFTVELVRADTKEAFKEHTSPSNGQVFAEVEPGMEYFIRVGSPKAGIHVDVKVDGEHIGYNKFYTRIPTESDALFGGFERKNGIDKMTALRFNLASGGVATEGTMLTGRVEVCLSTLGEQYTATARDFTSTEFAGNAKASGKKCVVSGKGSSVLKEEKKERLQGSFVGYDKGTHLQTITLHYCTAVGLIVNKILAPPPAPETEETKPRVKREKKRKAAVDLTEDDGDLGQI